MSAGAASTVTPTEPRRAAPLGPITDLTDCAFETFGTQIAIETAGQRIRYDQLAELVDRLASGLVGVLGEHTPGARVAVLLDDRVALIVALLAVFRTGSVFVPLDPNLPEERLRVLLERAKPQVLILAPGSVPRLGAFCRRLVPEATTLPFGRVGDSRLETLEGQLATYPIPCTRRPLDPEAGCYVYFTSGSTGVPKGILGRSRALSHFVRWETARTGFAPGWRVAQLTTPTFDAYLRDVLLPLANGGTVCLPPFKASQVVIGQLTEWLEGSRIQLVHCVPSLFSALVDHGFDDARFEALRYVLVAGDVLPMRVVESFLDRFGDRIALLSLYGLTESTMIKFCHRVTRRDVERGFIPLGEPLPGARALLLDERGGVCAPGEVGELYLRSPFLTLGYLDDPVATEAVFVPNPLTGNRSDRVLRTGDLARRLSDGTYQFLGRRDHQVKVRGNRVELGEVESQLRRHPQVRAAVVTAPETAPGERRLVAYVVADTPAPTAVSLRTWLAGLLPSPMVPERFAFLDELPLTPNGKVDRKALMRRALESDVGEKAETARPPRTATERTLAALWSELLEVETIGLDDDFFALGGHSLLAARMLSQVEQRLGFEPSLRRFFARPTLATLADSLAEQGGEDSVPITAAEDAATPLSYGQARLWYLARLEPDDATYNIALALDFEGALNPAALSAGLSRVVERHGVLRATFPLVEGEPVQQVTQLEASGLPTIDLGGCALAARQREVDAQCRRLARRPFELTRERPLRVFLLRLGTARHRLLVTVHHIAWDGRSSDLFVHELATWIAIARGEVVEPPPTPAIQYADFARWQRRSRADEDRDLEYWRRQLASPPFLELPTDRPRTAIPQRCGAVRAFRFDANLVRGLRALGQGSGASLFMVLLAGFQTLLHRLSGQDDVVVGVPSAGRERSEIRELIGFFVNTLALRTRVKGDLGFHQLLAEVKRTAFEAYAHQGMPFDQVVEALQPRREASRNPFYQVMLTLEEGPLPELELSELRVRASEIPTGTAKLDAAVFLRPDSTGGLEVLTEFASGLFDGTTIGRWVGHWRNLLAAMIETPLQPVASLDLLSAGQRHQLLVEWNDTARQRGSVSELRTLWTQQVADRPGAVALMADGAELSYRQLDRVAGCLARALREAGLGVGETVALLLPPGPRQVVAVLAALLARGVYLPLDPEAPVERNRWLLEDAAARAVVTTRSLRSRLPVDGPPLLLFDGTVFDDLAADHSAIDVALHSEGTALLGRLAEAGSSLGPEDSIVSERRTNLAAVSILYTSGSTGTPKGVVIPQVGIERLVCRTHYVRFRPGDRVAQVANLGFDAASFEIWGALLNGATLVFVPREELLSPGALEERIRSEAIDVMLLTTPVFHQLARQRPAMFRGLDQLFVGGDALDPTAVREVLRHGGPRQLVNGYGPTENSTISTTATVTDVAPDAPAVPIGRPISGSRAHVLDRGMRPVPIGGVGELYLGGEGVALGYCGQSGQTAEFFVPDPLGESPGARLYRSGDQAYHWADGRLVFRGRRDRQVKVRGFRIEPGEVEAALTSHPEVHGAWVDPQETPGSGRRLVAYVAAGASGLDAEALQTFLETQLPRFLIPSTLVVVEHLPLTANGKIDTRALRALPLPTAAREAPEASRSLDSNEQRLAEIWAEVLGLDTLPRADDNYFSLGGDSILSIRVLDLAARAGLGLTLRDFLLHQTLAEQAARIQTRRSVVEVPEEVTGEVPLTPIQRWFFEHTPVAPHHFAQAVRLVVPADRAPGSLASVLGGVVRGADALWLRFVRQGAGWRQHYVAARPPIDLPTLDLGALTPAIRSRAVDGIVGAIGASLDLTNGPLFRGCLLNLGSGEVQLLLVAHHLVIDNLSWSLLLSELRTAWRQRSNGGAELLPEKTTSYQGWAQSLVDAARSPTLRAEADLWLVADRLPPPLPVDGLRDPGTVASEGSREHHLDALQTRALLHGLSRSHRPRDVLLTALTLAFYDWTGQRFLWVDLEHHGREAVEGIDLSRTVGWFTTVFPVLLDLRSTTDPIVALEDLAIQLDRIPRNGLDYGLLRYGGGHPAIASRLQAQRHPELSFNYHGRLALDSSERDTVLPTVGEVVLTCDPRQRRPHLFEIDATIQNDQLCVRWSYGRDCHRKTTLESLARRYQHRLEELFDLLADSSGT